MAKLTKKQKAVVTFDKLKSYAVADAIDMVKLLKSDGLSEDLAKDAETKVQSITNNAITKVDEILAVKEKDIMTV